MSKNEDEENPGDSTVTSTFVPTPIYQTSPGQYIPIVPSEVIQLASPGTDGVQEFQTLTTTNIGDIQQGTILQYTQTLDGQQILVPSNQVLVQTLPGGTPTYQICPAPSATSLPVTSVMTSPAVTPKSQSTKTEDLLQKREARLMKNREAARVCRRKKKEYVKSLENRVATLENQNRTLLEQIQTLKDLYSHKNV